MLGRNKVLQLAQGEEPLGEGIGAAHHLSGLGLHHNNVSAVSSADSSASVFPQPASLQDRLNYAAPLVRKGLARLPDDLLEKYLPLMNRLLISLSDVECGKFVRNELSAAELRGDTTRVVAAFSAEDAHTWYAVLKSAIEAALDNDPVITITTQDANDGIRTLAGTLPDGQGATFLLKLRRLQTANDSGACSTARILYSHWSALPEPHRGHMARLLLTLSVR